ncbi:MAG: sirohydrochlorin chelatase [Alicyclobacillus sp.]|nr:sirohydrochlorin chelatase [Alicyclobacillus sp.]
MMRTAVLLIGHGTRRPQGVQEFLAFSGAVRRVSGGVGGVPETVLWRHAFLEYAEPDIPSALASLAAAGVTRVVCVPLLLFAAQHLKQDIPAAIARCSRASEMDLEMGQPFGTEPAFVDVAWLRLRPALVPPGGLPADAVLFLGRGNRDAAAQLDVGRAAEALAERMLQAYGRAWPMTVGYLAGTGCSLEAALDQLAAEGRRRVVVLPYLWFSGYLTDSLAERIRAWRSARATATDDLLIRQAHHLGVQPALVDQVAKRVAELVRHRSWRARHASV